MRPEATMTAFLLDVDDGVIVRQVVVMVARDGKIAPLKRLKALTAEWPEEVVGFKALDGYLGYL